MAVARFDATYHAKQQSRVMAAFEAIADRNNAVRIGRVIPEHKTLPIGTGRQLVAAVLFLDICGFSSRPSDSFGDQFLQMRDLTLFFSEMIRVVEDFGGFVEKNTGDGLMAYFTSVAGEARDSRQLALSAALTMFWAAEKLINPIMGEIARPELHFRVTVDYGAITIAEVGAARGFRGVVAIGTVANIASKMLSLAGRDDLLIGARMTEGLPLEWINAYLDTSGIQTGWYYEKTGEPYLCYKYNGRWVI